MTILYCLTNKTDFIVHNKTLYTSSLLLDERNAAYFKRFDFKQLSDNWWTMQVSRNSQQYFVSVLSVLRYQTIFSILPCLFCWFFTCYCLGAHLQKRELVLHGPFVKNYWWVMHSLSSPLTLCIWRDYKICTSMWLSKITFDWYLLQNNNEFNYNIWF